MAAKKRKVGRPKKKKASKSGAAWHKAMMAAKAAKHGGKKRGKKAVTRAAGSPVLALGLLEKIDKKVTRIDRTVNAGHHLARKARKAARKNRFSSAFEDAERSGELAE
jgi:hypothetical protein